VSGCAVLLVGVEAGLVIAVHTDLRTAVASVAFLAGPRMTERASDSPRPMQVV
jgi:hypothetical protein